jgi:hypothetical protein
MPWMKKDVVEVWIVDQHFAKTVRGQQRDFCIWKGLAQFPVEGGGEDEIAKGTEADDEDATRH